MKQDKYFNLALLHRESDYISQNPLRQEAVLNEDISYKYYTVNNDIAVSEVNSEPILKFLERKEKR